MLGECGPLSLAGELLVRVSWSSLIPPRLGLQLLHSLVREKSGFCSLFCLHYLEKVE